ncbi:MAG: ATP-binding protein [archaeon]
MSSIKLEDHIMRAMGIMTTRDMTPLLSNIEITLPGKFGSHSASLKAVDDTKKAVVSFGSIYNSVASALEEERSENDYHEDEFVRLYMAYVASEGTKQLLGNGTKTNLSMNISTKRLPVNFNLDVTKTDKMTLSDALDGLYSRALGSVSSERVKDDVKSYLDLLSDYCVERMNEPLISSYMKNLKDVTIVGKGFKVEGIVKKEKIVAKNKSGKPSETSEHAKDLEEAVLDPVIKDDIVGNKSAIKIMDTEIPCLMHYDLKEGRNIFKGFQQYILFVGGPGTGKTMMARYGMTIAKDIGDKHNIPVSIVKLDFEDRWQYGPLENMRKQFKEISEGNRPYIVFIDEIETKIPSRSDGTSDGYRNDIIGEFLRFRGGGDYINKGNYIILATTNKPQKVDPAIIDVFKVEEVPGPKTPDEKAQVLYNNLRSGIDMGFIQVKNWEKIVNSLGQYNLSGRDLFNIAKETGTKYRQIAQGTPYGSSATEKEVFIGNLLKKDGKMYITKEDDIINSIMLQVAKGGLAEKSYLK